jgi:hypothetical protein
MTRSRLSMARTAAALVGAALLAALGASGGLAAPPAEPSCGFAKSAAVCTRDADGCDVRQGFHMANPCASTASSNVRILQEQNFFKVDGTGSSAFASLYCSDGSRLTLSGNAVHPGEQPTCPRNDFMVNGALRSVCGQSTACGSK